MNLRKRAFAVLASASLLAACGEVENLRATLPTATDSFSIFALSGTPATYPSGINTYVRQAVRVDGNANFDVAFDINAQGNVVVYPVQRIVSTVSADRRVGLRKMTGASSEVITAPTGIYDDTAVVVGKGEVVVVEARRNGVGDACQFDISPFIFTKLIIADIILPARTIIVQTVLNPNCGFRSFEEGIPSR
ncbi:MAG TPA: hypothetical protein VM939_04095 [Gemmatimonadaceae bacterium]|nr:hypothetical protein [Gemmatimonadaceae bacterium]